MFEMRIETISTLINVVVNVAAWALDKSQISTVKRWRSCRFER